MPDLFHPFTLDYRVKPFEFLIGGVDYAEYVSQLTVYRPRPSLINPTPYSWRGSFQINYTLNARLASVPKSQFSESASPATWRKGMSKIEIKDQGQIIAVMRLDDSYRFDDYLGSGNLIDVIELLSFSRPDVEIPEVIVGQGTPIRNAIQYLCEAAGKIYNPVTLSTTNVYASYFPSPQISGSYPGVIDTNLVTRNPIQDAQVLAAKYGYFLYVDTSERIRDVRYFGGTTTFVRGDRQVELSPDRQISFFAERVIVAGSREVAEPFVTDPVDQPVPVAPVNQLLSLAQSAFDNKGRLSEQITQTQKPLGVINPNPNNPSFDTTQVITEEKRTRYYYGYKLGSDGVTIFTSNIKPETLLKTITTRFQPKAEINPNAKLPNGGWQPTLLIAEEIVETAAVKKISQIEELFNPTPRAAFTPSTSNFKTGFFVVSVEKLAQPTLLSNGALQSDQVNPSTGIPEQLETPLPPEPLQLAPQVNLVTELIKGQCSVQATGYSQFLPKLLVYNAGFLPSEQVANNLACLIGRLELEMRDAWDVIMPVPTEYKNGSCLPFQVTNIHNKALRITQEVYAVSNTGKRSFAYTGGFVGTIAAVPNPRVPIPQDPYQDESDLAIGNVADLDLVINIPIIPVQFRAFGGVPPYVFSTTPLPTGLSLSASGLLTGTATVASASTSYTVTVTDSLSNTANTGIGIAVNVLNPVVPPYSEPVSLVHTTRNLSSIEPRIREDSSIALRTIQVSTIGATLTGVIPPDLPANDNFADYRWFNGGANVEDVDLPFSQGLSGINVNATVEISETFPAGDLHTVWYRLVTNLSTTPTSINIDLTSTTFVSSVGLFEYVYDGDPPDFTNTTAVSSNYSNFPATDVNLVHSPASGMADYFIQVASMPYTDPNPPYDTLYTSGTFTITVGIS